MQQARRIFLATSSGLERCLERELQALRVPGHLEAQSGGVLVTGTGESLWRATLQSRLADSVQLCLGEPFHAPDVRTLDAGLRELPWEDCLWLGGPEAEAPEMESLELRVGSHRSRLYHTRLVEERVRAAVAGRRRALEGDAGPRGSAARKAAAPLVSVQLRHDACQVSVAASGPLHRRGYRSSLGTSSLRETLAAACVVASPLLRRLAAAAAAGEELVVWDPFCNSGILLLEALGIALGQPPGDRKRKYPFASFPCHVAREYSDFLGGLQAAPHPGLSSLALLGTDSTAGEAERAQRNLRRFERRLWPSGGEGGEAAPSTAGEARDGEGVAASAPSLPCSVHFAEGAAASQARRQLAGRPTFLLTSLPQSGGAGASSQLGRLLRQRQADWRGAFCIASDAEEVRRQTALEWTTELRFLNKGRWVELLQWTGHQGRGGGSRAQGAAGRGRSRG